MLKRLIQRIRTWWKHRHCRHIMQYKGVRSDGIYRYYIYECPYCGQRFVQTDF